MCLRGCNRQSASLAETRRGCLLPHTSKDACTCHVHHAQGTRVLQCRALPLAGCIPRTFTPSPMCPL